MHLFILIKMNWNKWLNKTWAFAVFKYQLIQCLILLQPFPAQRWPFQLNKKVRIQMKHVLSINIHKPYHKSNYEVLIFLSQIYFHIFTQRLTTSTVPPIERWPCMISSLYVIWLNWPYFNSALVTTIPSLPQHAFIAYDWTSYKISTVSTICTTSVF